MQALILAAGRGSRMGEKTSEVPKCLLEVGGRSLIEHMLEALADCGVGPVAIATGYRADEIQEVVGIRAEFIENPRWNRTNSLYSFSLARDWVQGPLMVLNSDLLLDRQILERMADAGGNALAYDSSSGDAAEQMKVEVRDGALGSMSKTLPQEDSGGENVGVLTFDTVGARRLFALASEVIEAGGENDWLGSAVSKLALETRIRAVDVSGLSWSEIDFPYDLDRARKHTWPRIRGSRKRGRIRIAARAAAVIGVSTALLALTDMVALQSEPTTWEPFNLVPLPPIEIRAAHREQRWWRLDAGEGTEVHLVGPTRLRMSTRPLLAGAEDQMRYALDIALDGRSRSWDDRLATASTGWKSEAGTVGKRDSFEVDIAEGEHLMRIRLVSAEPGSVLLRVDEVVDDAEID